MDQRSATRNQFVGRQQEMALLEAALDDALSGQGRLVLLAGEPGIGKTRIAQELAAHARQKGGSKMTKKQDEILETLSAKVLVAETVEEALNLVIKRY